MQLRCRAPSFVISCRRAFGVARSPFAVARTNYPNSSVVTTNDGVITANLSGCSLVWDGDCPLAMSGRVGAKTLLVGPI